ncbi:hypothetical protein SISSUDRAFT_1037016 [Sistotremastrum suecicum HHB10207 ss-3]|uniref:C2H2-type domain-containing protein n=1 Tax=Sistotremastrum suecicum HHB10207 ss-3 TaxID=1314776 RepID=A0A165YPG2_9AGAM|nr:hypothetical protein SISSUDRAFT_1037016 [Sistotremastrum suecicum HHB10207 ss-3]
MPYAAKRSRGLATPSAALAATPPAPNKRAKKGSTPESVGWKCPICATVLNREKDSGRHLRTHDPDAEKYPCEMGCIDKWFTQEASRNVHYKSLAHNKSRPHGCKYCNKGFTTSRVLDRHVDEIHGPGRFKRIESWHKHRKTVHARETVVRPDPQYKRDVLTLARSPTDEGNNDRDDRPRGLAAEEQVDVHPYWMRTETMPSVDSPPVGFVTPVHIQQENINTRSTNFRDQSATDQTSRSKNEKRMLEIKIKIIITC